MERNTFVDDMLFGFKDSMKDHNQTSGLSALKWISKNQTYFILLFLPLFSSASYLAFIKSEYNYFEHLVINLYITGYQMIIYLILGFVFFKENLFLLTPFLAGFIYNIWAFNQLFENKTNVKKAMLIILTYLIFIIELIVIFLMAGLLYRIVK